MSHLQHNRDLSFTIVATVTEEYAVDFLVYDIVGVDAEGTIYWQKKDSSESTDNLSDAEVYLHGRVKWDGCSNWHFDGQDTVMLHGCSREDLERVGKILTFCWDWTAQLLPNWSP